MKPRVPPQVSRLRKGSAFAAMIALAVGGFEGVRTNAYLDPVGIPTVCFGETKGVRMGQSYSMDECNDMLITSLIEHETGMVKCLPNAAQIPDLTYGAFLSFTYNLGVGAFCGSTMAKKVRAGDFKAACNELTKWNKARKFGVLITLPGLTKRRAVEKQMCLKGLGIKS